MSLTKKERLFLLAEKKELLELIDLCTEHNHVIDRMSFEARLEKVQRELGEFSDETST